jgi:hypothetical protein
MKILFDSVIGLKGDSVPLPFQMSAPSGYAEQPLVNKPVEAYKAMQPTLGSVKRPFQLNMIPQRDPGMVVKTCKPLGSSIVRMEAIDDMFGVHPQMGNQRGGAKGLASSRLHPTNLPLMPHASSHFAGMNNKMGLIT